MSARTQLFELAAATTVAHAWSPTLLSTAQTHVSPSGQTHARSFPVLAAVNKTFTSFPPQQDDDDDDDDEQLLHTYASFQEEPLAALSVNNRNDHTWTLCIAVPIPSIDNPTLLALSYMIKYGTTCDHGNSTIQTDTILTQESLPEGVLTEATDLGVYKNKTGYAPRMVDHDAALCLSTTLAVKGNGGGEQWSHYIDNQRITPDVRVVDESHLYLVFHACEYPTARTVRSLSVEVSATWQKEEVEIKAREEAERKAKEEAEIKAKEEAERKARWAEERQEREEARQARAEEKQAREETKRARAAKLVANAPAVADQGMQDRIAETMNRLGLAKCDSGYAFERKEWGYQCGGGSHKVTWAQLGME